MLHERSLDDQPVPVIPLAAAPGERASWDRPRWVVYLWGVAELLFVANPWQVSSRLRTAMLRAFGADIGRRVVFRPRTRVRFPWKLHVGDGCWIGEGVWFHNQDHIYVGRDVAISQETLLTTGSHRHRVDMALVTRPIHVGAGTWVASRCVVLGGTRLGQGCLVEAMSRVSGDYPAGSIVGSSNAAVVVGSRFGERTR